MLYIVYTILSINGKKTIDFFSDYIDKNGLHLWGQVFIIWGKKRRFIMKRLSILGFIAGLFCFGAASAADIAMYYSPSCPHCHHAREFFVNKMVYEYPNLRVVQINVMDKTNLPKFREVLEKCNYKSGGVPVIVVGDKCFQGYADFMQQELRDAVEVDLSEEDKKIAADNKKAFEANPDEFRKQHSDRQKAVSEYSESSSEEIVNEKKNEKIDQNSSIYFYILLVALIVILGVVLVRKEKK